MKKRKIIAYLQLFLILSIISMLSFGFMSDDRNGGKHHTPVYKISKENQTSGKSGDAYRLFINNINLPLNRKGIIAAVNLPDPNPQISGAGGKFGNEVFLFSSGFFLSGNANGQPWANAVASASLVEDYIHGTVQDGQSDPRAQLYVLKKTDEPFGESWQDWIDAVALGADFYDGNGDGQYTPVDLNSNGEWDPDEDSPDLLGDETVWCVYHDGIPSGQRRWNTVSPLGIEVRQTVFAFASAGAIGNIIFVRYRVKYVGLGDASEPDQLDDVYFGVWADTDIGTSDDDLVGVDVPRNAGFVYNDGSDAVYGDQPPCFIIDFFSGPTAFVAGETFTDNNGNGIYDEGIDTPLDTAFSVRGPLKGVKETPGAKNLPITSFVHYQNGVPDLGDPDNKEEARFYMLGTDRVGNPPDPCDWAFGEVRGGVNCATVDNRFWYSGDPVANVGWINTIPADQRQMQNTGPMILEKGVENEIVVAYVVGQGDNAIDGITKARNIDDGAQAIFDNNFVAPSPPPAVDVKVSTSDNFIDLSWETPDQVSYENQTDTYDLKFKGYIVTAYKTSQTAPTVNNQPNSQVIMRYDLDDFINDLYVEDGTTGGIELAYPSGDFKLDKDIFTDPNTGKIRLRITQDPFTGTDLIKGSRYYFSVISYAVNHDALINRAGADIEVGVFGDYYLTASSFVGAVENIPKSIIVTVGEDMYSPPTLPEMVQKADGPSSGSIEYDVINKNELSGDDYQVSFFIDSSASPYAAFWKLENLTKNQLLIDSAQYYLYGMDDVAIETTDGFIVKVSDEQYEIGGFELEMQSEWIDTSKSDWHYVSKDLEQFTRLQNMRGVLSNANGEYVKADKVRRVELRFGENGKAYRYLNGFFGSNASRQQRFYKYAPAIVAADTVGKGVVGKLGEGFVDVPFTAWISDNEANEERQLAVGFIERRESYGGNPDGIWDPDTNYQQNGEYILVFESTYDPSGNQIQYTGGFEDNGETVWADLNGGSTAFYQIPDNANISGEELAIANSPLFNTLYAFGLSKSSSAATFTAGDKVILSVNNYGYSEKDSYKFKTTPGGALSDNEEKSIFQKVNVFPNPLFGFNTQTSQVNGKPDDPFVTFSNLPEEISIKIYSLSGQLLRTLGIDDKPSPTSPYLRWDLLNESGLRVASGMYLAIVSSPKYGEKILKFAIIMPQKQLQKF